MKFSLYSGIRIIVFSILVSLLSAFGGESDGKVKALEAQAAKGKPEAQFQLARLYFRGDEGVPKDEAKTLELMKKAAEKGYPDAIGGIGYFYASGIVVAKDDTQALEWFKKGAEKGSLKAQLNYGQMLRAGKGTVKNSDEGMKWIQKAADVGLPDAEVALGEIYYLGSDDRQPDYSKAFPLLLKAAEAGNAKAQNFVGVSYRDGLGAVIDAAKAAEWFRKSALQNDAKAQSNLGHLIGVESKDSARQIEALKWLILAASQGEVTASRTLNEITPHIPLVVMTKARAEANAFKLKQKKS